MTPRDLRLRAALHIYGAEFVKPCTANSASRFITGFIEFGTAPAWASQSFSFKEMIRLSALLEDLFPHDLLLQQLNDLRKAFGPFNGPQSLAFRLFAEAEARLPPKEPASQAATPYICSHGFGGLRSTELVDPGECEKCDKLYAKEGEG